MTEIKFEEDYYSQETKILQLYYKADKDMVSEQDAVFATVSIEIPCESKFGMTREDISSAHTEISPTRKDGDFYEDYDWQTLNMPDKNILYLVMMYLNHELNRASDAYYSGHKELMSNYDWDHLYDLLTELETETGIVLSGSPTQKTGSTAVIGKRKKITHEYPALSLPKSKDPSDLIKWADQREIWLSVKLDGLTNVLTYDNGTLSSVITRGDGIAGFDITDLADCIRGIPQKIDYKGHLIVRGEAVISYSDFERINSELPEDEQYANPRNLASGTLALLDKSKVKERCVQFIAFTLVHIDEHVQLWGSRMNFLKMQGFNIVPCRKIKDPSELPRHIEEFTEKIKLGYDIPADGLVICYNDTDYAATGSVTGHHATRAGFAFKWQDTTVQSTLRKIEWSVGTSAITPVAIFDPVQIEGTSVSRASLCNVSEIFRLDIGGEDSLINVAKMNLIIPKILSVSKKVGSVEIPSTCPVCGAKTEIRTGKNGSQLLYCTNDKCAGKNLRKFERFVGKECMDITGLSIQTIEKFINKGFLKDFTDIYELHTHREEIAQMDGFGAKSADNLLHAIDASRTVSAEKFLKSLCIPLIGADFGKTVLSSMTFSEFVDCLDQGKNFSHFEGIGPEKTAALELWYSDDDNKDLLKRLMSKVHIEDLPQKKQNGKCDGITFVITGDVHHFKNRAEFKSYVESEGGKVSGSVSKKTNYLVTNDKTSQSSKAKKSHDLGIKVISEDEFIAMYM